MEDSNALALALDQNDDFNPERQFIVLLDAHHPESEHWPLIMSRLSYPRCAARMDAWVEESTVLSILESMKAEM